MTTPLATIAIPAPHHDPAALGLHSSGELTLTATTYGHWRTRRNTGLRAVAEKLKAPIWPEAPEDRKDAKAEKEYRAACERAYRRGRDQRRALQGFLLAIAETDRRIAASTDEAARALAIAADILRGQPVSRATRRQIDVPILREAERIRAEIDVLGLADDPAVQERIATLLGELERLKGAAKEALEAVGRCFSEDHAFMERVGIKAGAVFARVDAYHLGLSHEAAELHAQKAGAAWRAA